MLPSSNQNLVETQTKTLDELLQNQHSVNFIKTLIKESYQDYFKGHEKQVVNLVDEAWDLLISNSKSGNDKLTKVVEKIKKEIFRKQKPFFWFNSMYLNYKSELRPQKDFKRLRQYISGKRILDYGSGGGYLALLLSQNGYAVSTTDVIDYRVAGVKHLPFKAMLSPVDVPYPDNSFDTTIIKAVLHHINSPDLPNVLKELKRISKQLIVEEDTYDLPLDLPQLQEVRSQQPQLVKFMSLKPEDQLQALMLQDYFSNCLVQGLPNMNLPFQFKTIPQWKKVLKENGFSVNQVDLLGFQPGNVNKSCHVWLIGGSE